MRGMCLVQVGVSEFREGVVDKGMVQVGVSEFREGVVDKGIH